MKTEEDAVQLARTMVQIGQLAGRDTVALVTDMNQPLGRGIGNALEVKEAILTLRGEGPKRLTELCIELSAEMLLLTGVANSRSEARKRLEKSLRDQHALRKFRELIEAQGGDGGVVDDLSLLPQARYTQDILAPRSGYMQGIDPLVIGGAAMELGAGRENKDTIIDLAVGIELRTELGDYVQEGAVLAQLFANHEEKLNEASLQALQAFQIGETRPLVPPTIYQKITAREL
jgi:pyrimidine-nucleoside phosphorylase